MLLKFWFDKLKTVIYDLGIKKSDFMYRFICTWLSLKGHSNFLPPYVYFQNGMSFYLLCSTLPTNFLRNEPEKFMQC